MTAGVHMAVRVIAPAAVMGCLALHRWPPYGDYLPLYLPLWLWMGLVVLVAAAAAWVGPENPLVPALALLWGSVMVPLAATASTAWLLKTPGLLDIMIGRALQRALAQLAPLLMLVVLGTAAGCALRARYGR